MPLIVIYPNGTVSTVNWSAFGAATVHEATDDLRGAYDDGSTAIWHSNPAAHPAGTGIAVVSLDDLPGGIASINSVQQQMRGKVNPSSTSNVLQNLWHGSASEEQLSASTTSWTTYTGALLTTVPSTGIKWQVAEINALELRYARVSPQAVRGDLTAGNVEVDAVLASGAFALFVRQWLPPLLAVASHGLMRREVSQILSHLKTRPSGNEEYSKLLDAFRVRPRFAL